MLARSVEEVCHSRYFESMRSVAFARELQFRVVALIFSLVGVSLSFLFVISPLRSPTIGQDWRAESIALIIALPLLSVCSFFSRKLAPALALIAVRGVVIWIIGAPYSGWLLFKLPLWSSLIIEAGGFLELPASLIVQACFLFSVLFSQASILIWGAGSIAKPDVLHLFAGSISLVCLSILLLLLRSSFTAVKTQEHQLARLDEAVNKLSIANLGFQRLASAAQERSAEDERKRITREIHDAIGYALTNLIMMMEAAIRLSPKEVAGLRDLLGQAREEAQVGLNETRKALRLLRNVSSEHLQGLSAVQRLVSLFRNATSVEVKAEYCNADQSYGEEADLVIYRIIQEGMTNAFRHGRATFIRLHFWQDANGVWINLWDNGKSGEEVVKEGIGLLGMRERLAKIGGSLQASRVVDGFEVRAWIPLPTRSATVLEEKERGDLNGQNIVASG